MPAVQTSTAIPLVTPADGATSARPEADREIVFSVSDLDVHYGPAQAVAKYRG